MSVSRGKSINITDYRESFPNAWRRDNEVWRVHSGQHSVTYYVSAPCFSVTFSIWKNWFASNSLYATMYKWNGQNDFVTYGSQHSISFDGSLAFNQSKSITFAHNADGVVGYDWNDNSDIHLWKIYVSVAATGADANIDEYITIRTGGIERLPQTSQYNYMWKKGSLLYASTGLYYTTSDYGSDIAFINAQKPGAFRGTPISAGTANYAYSVRE